MSNVSLIDFDDVIDRKNSTNYEEWVQEGLSLSKDYSDYKWKLGDWWNKGHKYGERAKLVESDKWDGPGRQTCDNAGTVSTAFEISRRREKLTWGHHAELTSLPIEEQDKLLDECEREGHSVMRLRQRVKDVKQAKEGYRQLREDPDFGDVVEDLEAGRKTPREAAQEAYQRTEAKRKEMENAPNVFDLKSHIKSTDNCSIDVAAVNLVVAMEQLISKFDRRDVIMYLYSAIQDDVVNIKVPALHEMADILTELCEDMPNAKKTESRQREPEPPKPKELSLDEVMKEAGDNWDSYTAAGALVSTARDLHLQEGEEGMGRWVMEFLVSRKDKHSHSYNAAGLVALSNALNNHIEELTEMSVYQSNNTATRH